GRTGEARDGAVQVRRQLLDQDTDAVGVVGEVLHVAARAEGAAGAGDDDAADGTVLIGFEGGVEELASDGQVQRVVGVRPVERDRGGPVLHVVANGLVAHLVSPPGYARNRGTLSAGRRRDET